MVKHEAFWDHALEALLVKHQGVPMEIQNPVYLMSYEIPQHPNVHDEHYKRTLIQNTSFDASCTSVDILFDVNYKHTHTFKRFGMFHCR